MDKELEEAIERLDHIEKYYDCNNYYNKYDLDCIETVLKELKRLQEENEDLKFEKRRRAIGRYGEMEVHEVIDKTLQEDYIAKDKIRENVEKIQNEYELLLEHQNGRESNRTKYLRGKIHMGQELLEGK